MQEMLGYSAQQAGIALAPGALVAILALAIVGYLSARMDARWLTTFGLVGTGLAVYSMTNLSLQVSFGSMVLYRIYIGVGIAFLFIPTNNMAYVGVAPEKNNQVSVMVNLARNLGGGVGIAILQTMLVRQTQTLQDRLSVHTS